MKTLILEDIHIINSTEVNLIHHYCINLSILWLLVSPLTAGKLLFVKQSNFLQKLAVFLVFCYSFVSILPSVVRQSFKLPAVAVFS